VAGVAAEVGAEVVAGAGAGTEAVRGARGLKEVMQIGCSDPSWGSNACCRCAPDPRSA
jgi:hypothetical protein